MKQLIKLVVIGILLSTATELSAQSFRIKAGLNVSTAHLGEQRPGFKPEEIESKYGFHAGATAEWPITGMFSFETGVLISTKGYKSTRITRFWTSPDGAKIEEKYNPVYIEIPLTAKATFDLGKTKLYGALGPYFAAGASGHVENIFTTYQFITEAEVNLKWGNNQKTDHFKRLDFGLTMGAGLEIHPMQIGFTYGLGLANIIPFSSDRSNTNNRVFGISAGYKFGKKQPTLTL